MEIYEYLLAAIIVVLMLVAASTMVVTLTDPVRVASQKEQLKFTGEKVMNQLLLDPGSPIDWGSENVDPSLLKTFGLAKVNGTSREAYTLDPDKVQRLDLNIGSSFISRQIASSLLNLENAYGFTFELNSTINMEIEFLGFEGRENYNVSLTSEYGQIPIIGANVSAIVYYLDSGSISKTSQVLNSTDLAGSLVIDFETGAFSNPKVLVLVVDYLGLQSTKIFAPNSDVTFSQNLGREILNSRSLAISDTLIEVFTPKLDGNYIISDFEVNSSQIDSNSNYFIDYMPEESMVGLIGVLDGNSMLVVFRDYELSYRTTPEIRSASLAYSLERTVHIGTKTYTATLYIWRSAY